MLNFVHFFEVNDAKRNCHFANQLIPKETLIEGPEGYIRFLCGLWRLTTSQIFEFSLPSLAA